MKTLKNTPVLIRLEKSPLETKGDYHGIILKFMKTLCIEHRNNFKIIQV